MAILNKSRMKKLLYILLFIIPFLTVGQVTKAQWITKFDGYWTDASHDREYYNYNVVMDYAETAGAQQEHYYMAWGFEGVLAAWRAGGDNDYLDDMIVIIEEVISNAQTINIDGTDYQGWNNIKYSSSIGVPLLESYLWRYVATLLRVMSQSPVLLATNNGAMTGTTYQDNYDTFLAFIEFNIWDKWEDAGWNNIYRRNTHMSSHWARIGMELHIITGTTKYKTVFDNISFDGLPSSANPGYPFTWGANLRDQLYSNGTAYSWHSDWLTASAVQDTDHATDIANFWAEAITNEYYWTETFMDSIVDTFDNEIWTGNSPPTWKSRVDGTGTDEGKVRQAEWINVARFDQTLQTRLEGQYYSGQTPDGHYAQAPGILALNQAFLEDSVVYPEGTTVAVTDIAWSDDVQSINTGETVDHTITWTPSNATDKGYTTVSDATSYLSNSGVWVSDGTANYTITADDTTNGTLTDVMAVTTLPIFNLTIGVLNAPKIRVGSTKGGAYLGTSKIN